ncbi:MAG: NAD(P)/FAD-dependent oxidoreductase [Clostridiales bacterium]|nr:NAD(P)/FAD-dependent oxidoreductase [Clostridiales bacterium]
MKDRSYGDKICRADVTVIGAGASGLMAAISAARADAFVTVLEHTAVSAKKILSTGNGRCNFTNLTMTEDCYRSDDNNLVMSAISRFSERDAVTFFEELGVFSKSRNGYCYPRNGQAAAIRDALIAEAKRLGIRFIYKAETCKIVRNDDFVKGGFQIEYNNSGNFIYTGCCILACGGMAAPKTGSDGSGYALAEKLGHTIQPPLPALVPLVSAEQRFAELAGVRCDACVSLYTEKEKTAEDTGELQFTDYGISGIPVFQVSRYAASALKNGKQVIAKIDFMPEMSSEKLTHAIERIVQGCGGEKTWRQILSGFCNHKIAGMICESSGLSKIPVCGLTEKQIRKQIPILVRCLKGTDIRIAGTRPMEQAQVTCGGVMLHEIGNDMQLKIVPGLYFAGEILNVDGICGGYNLQWAWSSGFLAGTSAAESALISHIPR